MRRKSIAVIAVASSIVVLGAIFGILYGTGVLSIGVTPVVTVPDEIEIVIHDALDSTNNDEIEEASTIAWYRSKVSNLEEEEIKDLAYADFSADGTGDDKKPDEDYVYIVKISGTDLVTKWFTTDSRLFEGYLPLLSLGINNVYIYNETEDLALSAYSPVGGTTFNRTDYRDWNIIVNCLDDTEGVGADVTSLEGYGYGYDPSVGAWLTPVIKVTFNTTATNAFGEMRTTFTVTEDCASTVMYFGIQCSLDGGETDFELRLGSGLGTTFEVTTLAAGWGYSGSFSSKDTQN